MTETQIHLLLLLHFREKGERVSPMDRRTAHSALNVSSKNPASLAEFNELLLDKKYIHEIDVDQYLLTDEGKEYIKRLKQVP